MKEKLFCVIIRQTKNGEKMEKTNDYRALFLIAPEKQNELEDITGRIKSVITQNSGKISSENLMGKKKVAYPVKKREEAVYLELGFEMLPRSVKDIRKQYRIDDDILRALIDRR